MRFLEGCKSVSYTHLGALSATERAAYILRVRTLAKACCESYLAEVAGDAAVEASNQKGEVA